MDGRSRKLYWNCRTSKWKKEWYKEGKIHREDGRVIELASGSKFWYLNGLIYYEKIGN